MLAFVFAPLLNCGRLASRAAHLAFVFGAVAILSGCATKAAPSGAWARLSDLDVNEWSLEHVKVAVRCGRFVRDRKVEEHPYPACRGLRPWLTSAGAEVVAAKSETEPDFTVWFIDDGLHDKTVSGVSFLGALFTAFIIPYETTSVARADLRILDRRGSILSEENLDVREVSAFGWAAIYSMFAGSKREDRRSISTRYYQKAINALVSVAPQPSGPPPATASTP